MTAVPSWSVPLPCVNWRRESTGRHGRSFAFWPIRHATSGARRASCGGRRANQIPLRGALCREVGDGVVAALTRRAIMRIPLAALGFGVALAAALPARADVLQGDRFITAMKDNTVSGKTAAGTSYNLYFLPGGTVTYDDAVGHRVFGGWQLDRVGDVCVTWHGDTALPAGC